MICNGKKLAAAMEKLSQASYQLCIEKHRIHIMGRDWAFTGKFRAVGNDVLAEIVRQLGQLPDECCLEISTIKTAAGKEVVAQSVMLDTFREYMGELWPECEPEEAHYTGLRLANGKLYQMPDGKILRATVVGALLAQSETEDGMAYAEAAVGWSDQDSEIRFRAYRPEEGNPYREKWEALERVKWYDT